MKAFLLRYFPRLARAFGMSSQLEIVQENGAGDGQDHGRKEDVRVYEDPRVEKLLRWQQNALPVLIEVAEERVAHLTSLCKECYNPWQFDGDLNTLSPEVRTTIARQIDRVARQSNPLINELIEFVLLHELDPVILFGIPRPLLRQWILIMPDDRRSELIQGKIDGATHEWMQRLIVFGLSTAPIPACTAPPQRPALEA